MLTFDPKQRITLQDIKNHGWFNDITLEHDTLIGALKLNFRNAEQRRIQDIMKMDPDDLSYSLDCHNIPCNYVDCELFFPNKEGINTIYSYGDTYHWKHIYEFIEQHISEMLGEAESDVIGNRCNCMVAVQGKGTIEFYIKVWRSRKFDGKNPNQRIYIVEPRRISGDYFVYQQIKQEYILKKWSPFMMGLPKWAFKMEKSNEPLYQFNILTIMQKYMNGVHNALEQYLLRYNVNYSLFLKPIFQKLLFK